MAVDSHKIILKNAEEIQGMRKAGKLAAEIVNLAGTYAKAGVSTLEINDFCEAAMKAAGGKSATVGYKGFPKAICTSINEEVCHGIPSAKRILKNGDIVGIDVALILNGFYGDTCRTYAVGEISGPAKLLLERTERALDVGLQAAKPGGHVGDIGNAIDKYISEFGYGIVRALGGHGVGRHFHEGPFVHHHRQSARGPKLKPGMTFTIEPMINEGTWEVYVDEVDEWTVTSKDESLSAQFEYTVLITEKGAEVLTPWK